MRPPDRTFADRRLAATYDIFEGERPDLDHYETVVTEFGAASVLDIGCGTGVLACRLALSGLTVIGVDPAEASIEIARTKPGAADVTWIVGDTTGVAHTEIDLAVMTGNVAQVFVTDEDWTATLTAARRAIRRGGHLVFETRRPEVRAWEQWTPERSRCVARLPTGETVESWNEVIDVAGELVMFRSTNVFSSDGAELTSESTLRFRSQGDIETSLTATGFEMMDVREAPDRPGMEMVFVAIRT